MPLLNDTTVKTDLKSKTAKGTTNLGDYLTNTLLLTDADLDLANTDISGLEFGNSLPTPSTNVVNIVNVSTSIIAKMKAAAGYDLTPAEENALITAIQGVYAPVLDNVKIDPTLNTPTTIPQFTTAVLNIQVATINKTKAEAAITAATTAKTNAEAAITAATTAKTDAEAAITAKNVELAKLTDYNIKEGTVSKMSPAISLMGGYKMMMDDFGFITEIGTDITFSGTAGSKSNNEIEAKKGISFFLTQKVGYQFAEGNLTYLTLGLGMTKYKISHDQIKDESKTLMQPIIGAGHEMSLNENLSLFTEFNIHLAGKMKVNGVNGNELGDVKLSTQQFKIGARYYM